MIIQTSSENEPRLSITMDEHTKLAGDFARAFGNELFDAVRPSELMLFLVSNHDKGWASWDAAPETDPRTALPYNLVDTPIEVIARTSTASAEFNESHHPYCGLLSSMHSWGLYNGRYGMSDLVLIDRIATQSRPLVDQMLAGELARQARLKKKLAGDPRSALWIDEAHLFQNYKQLQFFDTLALYFNRTHEGARTEATFKHVPLTESSDVAVRIRPLGHSVYEISPYPFAEPETQFSFNGKYIHPGVRDDDLDWARVLSTAPTASQRFTLVAGHE